MGSAFSSDPWRRALCAYLRRNPGSRLVRFDPLAFIAPGRPTSRGRYLPDAGEIRLGTPVVGKEAVDLLLDVGELRVTEALHDLALQQREDQGLVALHKLFGARDRTVAPVPGVRRLEGDATELGDEDRLAPVPVSRRVYGPTLGIREARLERSVALGKDGGVPVVV